MLPVDMYRQPGLVRESFIALCALVGFLIRMGPHVNIEIGILNIPFITNSTLKPSVDMDSQMSCQAFLVLELFSTYSALVVATFSMDCE